MFKLPEATDIDDTGRAGSQERARIVKVNAPLIVVPPEYVLVPPALVRVKLPLLPTVTEPAPARSPLKVDGPAVTVRFVGPFKLIVPVPARPETFCVAFCKVTMPGGLTRNEPEPNVPVEATSTCRW